MHKPTKYQKIAVAVAATNTAYSFSFTTDKVYKRITGVFVSPPNVLDVPGSTLNLIIANQEIFPDDYPIDDFIYANNSVEPDVKYKTINEEADGSEVKGTLTTGSVLTAPADFNIWLRLEIE